MTINNTHLNPYKVKSLSTVASVMSNLEQKNQPGSQSDLEQEPLLESNLVRKNELDQDTAIEEDDDSSSISSSTYTLNRSDSFSSSFIDLSKLLILPDFDFGLQVGDSTRKRFNEMKSKTKQRLKQFKDDSMKFKPINSSSNIKRNLELQDKLLSKLSHFDKRVSRNLQSSNTEKFFYAMAVFSISMAGFIIGKYPTYFHVFHLCLFVMLMPIRFYTYFKIGFKFYLADLCYYVNILLMLFIWWFPNSESLFISVFSLAMGTLSFAVITWRNSLVLHLIEKTTSSFIHIMPPITLFVIVHELPQDYLAERFPAVATLDHWNFIGGIIWTSIYYTIWQVTYHYFITIKRKEEIEKGTVTSFTYLKKKNSKSALGKFVNSLPYTWMQITAFTLIQFGYQILTMVFCPIWFKYKHACGFFVTFIFVWASYNGATYYIDVFGKRFEKEVNNLKNEIVLLKQENEKLFNNSPFNKPNMENDDIPIKPLELSDVNEEKP